MERRVMLSPESAEASDIFDKFCSANTLKSILSHYRQLCNLLRIKPTHFPDFYPRLKAKLCSWRAQGVWAKIEKRASAKCYGRGKACASNRVLIIGAGPCGLRTAIEAQMLGAKVVLIEKRDRFSRNNVLHLWPFVISDLKGLGAKKFYGKFCAGSIDHISIRQLQCLLLKVALLLGVEIHEGVGFDGLREPTENEGWRAITSPPDHPVSHYNFDCLIGADGRRNTLEGFRRKALRAKLAIAITANFINKRTEAEARVKEISGVSYIFNQKFFQDLNEATGIDLENIVYYKDETHYFVMTAKKQSLLAKGVLLQDYADTAKLLSHENISTENLMIYAVEAALFSTDNQLPDLEFAVNHYGQPDVAMFDFTAMYAAENACRVVQRKGHRLMMTLVGDSLLEPFWPTGSGCARGFLSSMDACWMLRSWSSGSRSVLEVVAERESIYRLLGQTTPENLNKEHSGYTVDPHSRYPNLNLRVVMPFQVKNLFDTDEKFPDVLDSALEQEELERQRPKRRRDSVVAVDSLLDWLRNQVGDYGLEINEVHDAFVRGDVLSAIIYRFRPDLLEYPLLSEENVDPLEMAARRNQIAFDFLQSEYGITPVISGPDSVQSNSFDFLTMVAYLSQIYDTFKGEIPQIKYLKDVNDDIEETSHRSSHHVQHVKHVRPPAVVVKHGFVPRNIRRSRVSSSSREGRGEGDLSDYSKRHRKRRSEERSRASMGKELKSSTAASSGVDLENQQHVTGLAKNLEEKLKGSKVEKKPKDLIRAIGKIEKSDWNVQLIERKIAENKTHGQGKKERDDKVPKWSREAYDDKREAMKRRMEGREDKAPVNDREKAFEDTMKKIGSKLREGNTREVGQRGFNKVSQMAEQIVDKIGKSKKEPEAPKSNVQHRPVFEPKKGGSEICHFCKQSVYVVERMTAEGKYFHRNCFRCEYCHTSLRLGNYSFEREGRYGDRFYCVPHYQYIRNFGWKKYDQDEVGSGGNSGQRKQQLLDEMDERGTTPERVEFENSIDFASEEELLSEDEWTDRNFGATNADNNTSDEASELSEDDEDDVTPEGVDEGIAVLDKGETNEEGDSGSSDSDTEVASGEEGSCDESDELEDEEEDEDEGEEECGGSTTEIETDSEFAEDPPQSVPGRVPTIVVDEPEPLITRFFDAHLKASPVHQRRIPQPSKDRKNIGKTSSAQPPKPSTYENEQYEELKLVEPVLKYKSAETRALPRVYGIPKKWEPLPENTRPQDVLAAKKAMELKTQYLHGGIMTGSQPKKPVDSATQNQFTSVLDMISEQQKRLQPAPKPSPAMQAFLDGTEKLKSKTSIFSTSSDSVNNLPSSPKANMLPPWSDIEISNSNMKESTVVDMNKLNIAKTIEAGKVGNEQGLGKTSPNEPEKKDSEKEIGSSSVPVGNPVIIGSSEMKEITESIYLSSAQTEEPSTRSQSQTESQCTVVQAVGETEEEDLGSAGDGSGDDIVASDLEENFDLEPETQQQKVKSPLQSQLPPRVEIEDEFGVTLALDDENKKKSKKGKKRKDKSKPGTKAAGVSKVTCGISSSESKDSLNSCLFLESEMSDWDGKTVENETNQSGRRNFKPKVIPGSKGYEYHGINLEALDYADMDELSSPDDHSEFRKKGYSRLLEDDAIVEHACSPIDEIQRGSASSLNDIDSSRSTTPTFGSGNFQINMEQKNIPEVPIEKVATGKPENVVLLDRVIPFSNARDSLDYRKRKGVTSPSKSKDLFSTYLPHEVNNPSQGINYDVFSAHPSANTSSANLPIGKQLDSLNVELLNKSSTSPNTARKLDEINKERVKQNELIKSMVMGRIRKSPEKTRRGSRGQLMGDGSSSSPSISCSSEIKVHSSSNDENSNRSSQNSILSHHNSDSEDGSKHVMSDPEQLRFKTPVRPTFKSPFNLYHSVTNPPTPVNPSLKTPITPGSDSLEKWEGLEKNNSPTFYGSMPNISLVSGKPPFDGRNKVNKVSSFISPSPKKWEDYKHLVSADRERVRQAARERARLKSDEELGGKGLILNNHYVELKNKLLLRRKLSVPEDDVFSGNTTTSQSEPTSASSPLSPRRESYPHSLQEKSTKSGQQPPHFGSRSDLVPVAASIRHNVDFPIKKNPFIVSEDPPHQHRHPHYKRAYSVDSKPPMIPRK